MYPIGLPQLCLLPSWTAPKVQSAASQGGSRGEVPGRSSSFNLKGPPDPLSGATLVGGRGLQTPPNMVGLTPIPAIARPVIERPTHLGMFLSWGKNKTLVWWLYSKGKPVHFRGPYFMTHPYLLIVVDT